MNDKYTKNRKQNNRSRSRENFDDRSKAEISEGVVYGRNSVKELLASGRDIEKLYIQSGDREGSVNLLIGIASERKIPIVEVDRTKLDSMVLGERHQGVVAIASERNYATVEEILAYALERSFSMLSLFNTAFL